VVEYLILAWGWGMKDILKQVFTQLLVTVAVWVIASILAKVNKMKAILDYLWINYQSETIATLVTAFLWFCYIHIQLYRRSIFLGNIEKLNKKATAREEAMLVKLEEIRIERTKILDRVTNDYNGLSARLEKLEYKRKPS
jgi:uncharacterized protein YacL